MTSSDQASYESLKASGAFLPPGAPDIAVEILSDDLEAKDHARLPSDYASFLTRADGAQSAAFVLYGTTPQELAGGQSEPDLFAATRQAAERGTVEGDIVLGRASGNLTLVFSGADEKYLLKDSASGDVLYAFERLADFVNEWLARKKL